MEKKSIFDIFFLLGFIATLVLIYLGRKEYLIIATLVLLYVIARSSFQDILEADIYVIVYFIGAIITSVSIVSKIAVSFYVGLILMLLSIIFYKIAKKKAAENPAAAQQQANQPEETKRKIAVHPLIILWGLIAFILIYLAIIQSNRYLLYIGIAAVLFTGVLFVIISKHNKNAESNAAQASPVAAKIEKKKEKQVAAPVERVVKEAKPKAEKPKKEEKAEPAAPKSALMPKEEGSGAGKFILPIILILFTVILFFWSISAGNRYLLYIAIAGAIFSLVTIVVIIKSKKISSSQSKPSAAPQKQAVIIQKVSHSMQQLRVDASKRLFKYETDIDKLYRLIEKYRVIRLSEVQEVFKIDNEKAEKWSKILEEHELIDLYYPMFGEPRLKWRQLKPIQ